MKAEKQLFLIFLIVAFLSGIYFSLTHTVEGLDAATPSNSGISGPTKVDCPDLLIRSGNTILLYNSKMQEEPGVNPLPFYNLDEYINYLEIQKKAGIHCPVLFLQEESNAQGNQVYRIRPDIFNPNAGLPVINQQSVDFSNPKPVVDSSDDRPPWNAGTYQGFDPIGLHIGQYTKVDAIHDSTHKGGALSENPMDPNWGGVIYTKNAVDSGKYKDNEVYPRSVYLEKSDNIRNDSKKNNIFS